ncbi:MAG: DUF4402 domain-containing protein [Shewanellaceae bacterium]|nr:DUF4402 domain-containing protein [Shewanellaceae bacterium]
MKKISILLMTICSILPTASNSAQTDVHAQALFMQALNITNVTSMNFGALEFDSNDPGGIISLSNDGTLTPGTSGYLAETTGTAGSFTINATAGELLTLSCSTSALLVHEQDANKVLGLFSINYSVSGMTLICTGSGASVNSAGMDIINIGGSLQVPSGSIATQGSYSTQNTGGNPVIFSVVYQ